MPTSKKLQSNIQSSHSTTTLKPQLDSFSDLFRQTWEIFKNGLGTYVSLALFPMLVAIPMFILIGVWAVLDYTGNGNPIVSWFLGFLTLLMFVFMFIGILWGQVATIVKVHDTQLTFKEALRASRGKLASFFWVGALTVLVIMGGYVLLVIPGLMLIVYLFFSAPVNVYEEKKGLSALIRSRELIRGLWWPILGRWILLMIIYLAISMAVNLVTLGIGSFLIGIFFNPILSIFMVKLYDNVVQLKGKEQEKTEKGRTLLIILGILGAIILPVVLGFGLTAAIKDWDKNWDELQNEQWQYNEDSLSPEEESTDTNIFEEI